jgi:phosphomannomutase
VSLIKSISGIRGTIGGKAGDGLTPIDVVKFAAAYGAWVLEKTNNPKIIIGRDARISGDMISRLVSATLQGLGIDVIDLGLSTTPTVELAVPLENAGGGIILTASHNPIQWNALKLLNSKGEFISDEEGKSILEKAEKEDFIFAEVKKLGTVGFGIGGCRGNQSKKFQDCSGRGEFYWRNCGASLTSCTWSRSD